METTEFFTAKDAHYIFRHSLKECAPAAELPPEDWGKTTPGQRRFFAFMAMTMNAYVRDRLPKMLPSPPAQVVTEDAIISDLRSFILS